ncbi:MAG: endonuclease [Bacteroidetes bacterium HGW-Bacteroidetes-1]|jgi:endonuclease/exonuclease/phosphatase family metal-dependent hydrolase|nr:MAG: endonuclease [Bacteroidetes bacterium HGW-Bacteroidetes-1]
MKLNYLLLLVFILFVSAGFGQNMKMNVMTFNVRLDHDGDGQHNWKYRKDATAELLQTMDVDILGTQEVLRNQLDDFLLRLPSYRAIGVGRADGKTKGEYSAILYKADRFDVEDSGNFWLSETPDKAGSKGWDAAYERVVTWARMKDMKTGIRFMFFNTHFDHKGEIARKESAILLMEKIRNLSLGVPVILSGDFNGILNSDPVRIILENGFFFDSRTLSKLVKGPDWSFHGFGLVPVESRGLIDFIFLTKEIEAIEYENIFRVVGDTYLSDHNPVFVKIVISQ